MTYSLPIVAGCLSVLTLLACAESTVPPLLPDPGSDGTYTVDWPDMGHGEDRYISIDIGPDSFEKCRGISPKFPFDSAKTRVQDRMQIAALASCLNHDSMLDRKVLLIGRADASGTSDYNRKLGLRRGQQIKGLLMSSGLAENRIRVATAGETEAVGDKPEYSQGYDRRVDVVVLGGVHSP